MKKFHLSRRQALKGALFGSGYLGLQSLATGIPISALVNGIPKGAHAQNIPSERAQFLILNSRTQGDSFNAHVPGTYVNGVVHSPAAAMQATDISLGGVQTRAAAPWATLPQWALDQTTFIHHRTYQNAHPQHNKVMGLLGNALGESGTGTELIQSVYASEMAALLGTVQREPIALSGRSMTFEGRALQNVAPQTLSQLFAPLEGDRLQLLELRRSRLDQIHNALRQDGTPDQRRWLDRYASSSEQIQTLDESLLSVFANINSNDQNAQIDAAIALIQMRVSPVIQVSIAFGSDNHNDANLVRETTESIAGIGTIAYLFSELEAKGLQDQVTFANLSVFGRTLSKKGTRGRDHNLNHHAMMISGRNVNPGIVGSIARSGNDWGATAINAQTGEGGGGDIPVNESLEAATKTLGSCLGVSNERINARIRNGRVITAALRS